jgi:hypothetical protein
MRRYVAHNQQRTGLVCTIKKIRDSLARPEIDRAAALKLIRQIGASI